MNNLTTILSEKLATRKKNEENGRNTDRVNPVHYGGMRSAENVVTVSDNATEDPKLLICRRLRKLGPLAHST